MHLYLIWSRRASEGLSKQIHNVLVTGTSREQLCGRRKLGDVERDLGN